MLTKRSKKNGGGGASAHRYWRANFLTAAANLIQLLDMQFRSTPGGADQTPVCTGDNMGAAGTVIYTAGKSTNVGNEVWRIFDSNSTTQNVGTFDSSPMYIGFVFPTAISIVEISYVVDRADRYPTSIDFDYSDDGITWTNQKSITGITDTGAVFTVVKAVI